MKNYLPFFQHDSNARNHPKMKALKAEYGLEGYARFWILNERIAESEGAFIDISKKINKFDLANELELNGNKLDDFLNFLSDPEIDLINIENGKITTDRLHELHKEVMNKRKKRRKTQNAEMDEHFEEMTVQNAEMDEHFDTNKIKENKINNKESESFLQALDLSNLLLKLHRKEYPDFLSGKKDSEIKTKLDGWAKHIEQLIRIDHKTPENISKVIEWVKTPGCFWFPNIVSGKKLREKYDTLWAQMNSPKNYIPDKPRNYLSPTYEQSEKLINELEENRKLVESENIEIPSLSENLKETLRGNVC